ncbi:hypothetical protein AZE42_05141 [Rhizopogon vesiculosus]|uniref:Uncharacterized protein n=1 Tax=Rhizopogon vesiculosus TaxID=180088 RepID=A0A1J8PSG7_9AGAM|nr:hypothetical protein AZE42_05141 [Rhizopogon vesiculosus]
MPGNDFYSTSDANFDPANVFQGRFADIKLNFHLTAGRDEAFKYSSEDFPPVPDNLRALEKLVPKEIDYETLSVIQETLVADQCKGTFKISYQPTKYDLFPAYDENHALIPPLQHESKLQGTLVEVHMAIYHHRFKTAMPSSPFKYRRLNAGPSTE